MSTNVRQPIAVESSHRAHVEPLAERFQGGGDAVDSGGVLDVGEAVDLLRGGLQAPRQFRGANVLLDHLVEEENLGREAGGKLNDVLPRPGFGGQRHRAIVFEVEVEGRLQSIFGRRQYLGLSFPLCDSFGNVFERGDETGVLVAFQRNWIQEHCAHLFQAELFLDGLDQTFFEFGIVHRQNRLPSVQIDLKMRAFASLEDRSRLREPTPELFARHVFYYKQYCLYRQAHVACRPLEGT